MSLELAKLLIEQANNEVNLSRVSQYMCQKFSKKHGAEMALIFACLQNEYYCSGNKERIVLVGKKKYLNMPYKAFFKFNPYWDFKVGKKLIDAIKENGYINVIEDDGNEFVYDINRE